MKTIQGIPMTTDSEYESRLHESISEIIPKTDKYFSVWRSHDFLGHDGEQYVVKNCIYTIPSGLFRIKVIGTIELAYKGKVPEFFFDFESCVVPGESESTYRVIKIIMQGHTFGYYIPNINTLLLSDCSHRHAHVLVFKEIWPELVEKLSLKPIDKTKSKPEKYIPNITIGCDPEYELTEEDGSVVEAEEVIRGGTHEQIGCDGAGEQVEVRPEPGNPRKVVQNIRKLIKKFARDYPEYDISDEGNIYPLGGHIHVGVGRRYRPNEALVCLLDDFVGIPTLELSGEARDEYKALSQVRVQTHGFE